MTTTKRQGSAEVTSAVYNKHMYIEVNIASCDACNENGYAADYRYIFVLCMGVLCMCCVCRKNVMVRGKKLWPDGRATAYKNDRDERHRIACAQCLPMPQQLHWYT